MTRIYIDADGCPVKQEVYKVAWRHGLKVTVVANARMRVPEDEDVEQVVVDGSFDAADDWIVSRVSRDDIVISSDIPLAARALEKGARVLGPNGREFTPDSIGEAMANRELMAYLRESGTLTGGPAPFEKRDRSRFLQRLEEIIQSIARLRPAE